MKSEIYGKIEHSRGRKLFLMLRAKIVKPTEKDWYLNNLGKGIQKQIKRLEGYK